jgi:hypothetical protein
MVFEAAAPLSKGYPSDLGWDPLDAAVNMSSGLGT